MLSENKVIWKQGQVNWKDEHGNCGPTRVIVYVSKHLEGGWVLRRPSSHPSQSPSPVANQLLRASSSILPCSALLCFFVFQTRSIQSRFLQSRNLNCIALCEGMQFTQFMSFWDPNLYFCCSLGTWFSQKLCWSNMFSFPTRTALSFISVTSGLSSPSDYI